MLFIIFIISEILIGGRRAPWAPPLATPMVVSKFRADVARSGTPDVNSGTVPGIPARLATLHVTH